MASLQAGGHAAAMQVCRAPSLSSLGNQRNLTCPTAVDASRLASLQRSEGKFQTSPGRSLAGGSARRGCAARAALALQGRSYGAAVVQGTARANLEDTLSIEVDPLGAGPSFFGVFDGHGGAAVAELLRERFWRVYKNKLAGADPARATSSAYLDLDSEALAQPKGLFGALRERGVGGSRCGSTAATLAFLPSAESGRKLLVAANVGDARVVLCRGGKAVQMTFDHTPGVEAERRRIEAKNPTPKKPLIVKVGGAWRVGGLLNLSRAFGDACLKGSADGDGTRGGYGVTADPHVTVEVLMPDDEFIILGTDGLWQWVPNEEAVELVRSEGKEKPLEAVVDSLIKHAQKQGSTDDICVVIVRPLEVPGCNVES